MRDVLLTIHILAAAGWIGGGLYATIAFPRHAARSGPRAVAAVDMALGNYYFGPVVVLVLLSGIGLVLDSGVYGWSSVFVWIGIGVIVLTGILEGVVFGPAMKRIAESDELSSSGRQTLWWGLATNGVIFVVVVWAMVTKLGA